MPVTPVVNAIAALPGLIGHWDMKDRSAFAGSLGPLQTDANTSGTLNQSSLLPGDPLNRSASKTGRDKIFGKIASVSALNITRSTLGCFVRLDIAYDQNTVAQRVNKYAIGFVNDPYGRPTAHAAGNTTGVAVSADAGLKGVIAPLTPIFLCQTYDGSNLKLYFDAVLVAQTPLSGNLAAGSEDFLLGASNFGSALVNGLVGAVQHPFLCSAAAAVGQLRAIHQAAFATAAEVIGNSIQAYPWPRLAVPAGSRTYAVLSNGSDSNVWACKGGTSVCAVGSGVLLEPGGAYRFDNYSGELSVISENYMGGKTIGIELG
jgi:hypothetical protein